MLLTDKELRYLSKYVLPTYLWDKPLFDIDIEIGNPLAKRIADYLADRCDPDNNTHQDPHKGCILR